MQQIKNKKHSKSLKLRVLVVEDDRNIAEALTYGLSKEGCIVKSLSDGDDIISIVQAEHPDLVLLDWMLPQMSGLDICKALRYNPKTRNIPIIMISAKNDDIDKIVGLENGADDYITKPVIMNVLTARIRAVLRRLRPAVAVQVLEVDGIEIDSSAYTVKRNEDLIKLAPIEFRILQMLVESWMENKDRVLSREFIIAKAWHVTDAVDGDVDPRTVDVHIARLRRAFKEAGHGDVSKMIRTVRVGGYRFEPLSESEEKIDFITIQSLT